MPNSIRACALGARSGTIENVHGGNARSREVGVRDALLGVLFKDASARGPASFDGVTDPLLTLLVMAPKAWRRELWHGSACVSDPVVSRGATRLVGVVSRDFGVLLLLFGAIPLSFPFPLPLTIALRGAGVAKKKEASGLGGGLGIELGTVGC